MLSKIWAKYCCLRVLGLLFMVITSVFPRKVLWGFRWVRFMFVGFSGLITNIHVVGALMCNTVIAAFKFLPLDQNIQVCG